MDRLEQNLLASIENPDDRNLNTQQEEVAMKTKMLCLLAATLLAAPIVAQAVYFVQSVDNSNSCNPQQITSSDPSSISGTCTLIGGAVPTNFGTISSGARAAPGTVGARATVTSTGSFTFLAGGASSRATGEPINFSYNGPGSAPGETFLTSMNLDLKGTMGITGQLPNFSSAEVIFDVGNLGRYRYLLGGNGNKVVENGFAFTEGTVDGDIRNLVFDLSLTTAPIQASLSLPFNVTIGISVIMQGGAFVPSGAFASFYDSGTFAIGRPVFNLPDGYTANAGDYLVNNRFGDTNGNGTVPEPGTLALLGLGLAGLAAVRRRKK